MLKCIDCFCLFLTYHTSYLSMFFVCLFPMQSGAAVRFAAKHAMYTEGRLGHVLRRPACDYLPCGRRMCEVFLGWGTGEHRFNISLKLTVWHISFSNILFITLDTCSPLCDLYMFKTSENVQRHVHICIMICPCLTCTYINAITSIYARVCNNCMLNMPVWLGKLSMRSISFSDSNTVCLTCCWNAWVWLIRWYSQSWKGHAPPIYHLSVLQVQNLDIKKYFCIVL